jgi:hypothetical protein
MGEHNQAGVKFIGAKEEEHIAVPDPEDASTKRPSAKAGRVPAKKK